MVITYFPSLLLGLLSSTLRMKATTGPIPSWHCIKCCDMLFDCCRRKCWTINTCARTTSIYPCSAHPRLRGGLKGDWKCSMKRYVCNKNSKQVSSVYLYYDYVLVLQWSVVAVSWVPWILHTKRAATNITWESV